MKTWQSILLGIIFGILFSGVILLVGQQPKGQPVLLRTIAPPPKITIHISGGVVHPGVYELERSSRLQNAIQAAGGLADNANSDAVNLASPLTDGQKIIIPLLSTIDPLTAQRSLEVTLTSTPPPSEVTYPININRASVSDLEVLPGIGQSKAQQIILYRQEHGPFKTIEDIQKVPGIGAITFERIKSMISVSSLP